MHGREACLPMEVEKSNSATDASIDTTIERLQKVRQEIFPVAKQNIDESQQCQKRQYRQRKGVGGFAVKVDDLVLRLNMIKRTKKGHKMEDTWLGPYKVVDISQSGCCKLQCVRTGSYLKQKVNSCQLKLYQKVFLNTGHNTNHLLVLQLVYMHACMYVCMYIYIFMCVYVCMHLGIYV